MSRSPSKASAVYVESESFKRLFVEAPPLSPTSPEQHRPHVGSPNASNLSPKQQRPHMGSPLHNVGSPSASISSFESSFSSPSKSPSHSPSKLSLQSTQLGTSLQQLILRQKLELDKEKQEQRIQKTCKRHVEREREKLDEKHRLLTGSYDTSRLLLDEVDRELSLFRKSRATKTRRQFEDWNTNVHGEITRRINEQIDATSPKKLHKQKLDDYEKFLEQINRKKTVFRDIIIENEYDPLEVNRRTVKTITGRLKDATQIDKQKLESESGVKQKKGVGKDTLSVEIWADGKIQATPFGRKVPGNVNDEDGSGSPSKSPNKPKNSPIQETHNSSVVFDDFEFPRGRAGRLQLAKEMPRGKATFAKKVYANPKLSWEMPPDSLLEVLKIGPVEDD